MQWKILSFFFPRFKASLTNLLIDFTTLESCEFWKEFANFLFLSVMSERQCSTISESLKFTDSKAYFPRKNFIDKTIQFNRSFVLWQMLLTEHGTSLIPWRIITIDVIYIKTTIFPKWFSRIHIYEIWWQVNIYTSRYIQVHIYQYIYKYIYLYIYIYIYIYIHIYL